MKPRHDDGSGAKRGAGPYSRDYLKAGKPQAFMPTLEEQTATADKVCGKRSAVKRNDGAKGAHRNWGIDSDDVRSLRGGRDSDAY